MCQLNRELLRVQRLGKLYGLRRVLEMRHVRRDDGAPPCTGRPAGDRHRVPLAAGLLRHEGRVHAHRRGEHVQVLLLEGAPVFLRDRVVIHALDGRLDLNELAVSGRRDDELGRRGRRWRLSNGDVWLVEGVGRNVPIRHRAVHAVAIEGRRRAAAERDGRLVRGALRYARDDLGILSRDRRGVLALKEARLVRPVREVLARNHVRAFRLTMGHTFLNAGHDADEVGLVPDSHLHAGVEHGGLRRVHRGLRQGADVLDEFASDHIASEGRVVVGEVQGERVAGAHALGLVLDPAAVRGSELPILAPDVRIARQLALGDLILHLGHVAVGEDKLPEQADDLPALQVPKDSNVAVLEALRDDRLVVWPVRRTVLPDALVAGAVPGDLVRSTERVGLALLRARGRVEEVLLQEAVALARPARPRVRDGRRGARDVAACEPHGPALQAHRLPS
mmetsp:Transcript_66889/g.204853  ORF Transcript_66889/g.204853 Transcript_66889/m.204853 type:complete len:449 (-) Transcript_66889:554-1900(-)